MVLTMDLEKSAEILGATPPQLQSYLTENPQKGVLHIGNEWRISLFTLAQLLNTSWQELLTILEDDAFGAMLDEVADDEILSGDASLAAYQEFLAETEA